MFNADWVANPRSAPCTLRAGVSHVSTDTNDDATWTFPTLSHHLCLHSAAVLTASFSSRPPGGNATAEDEAQGSGEALDLEQLRGAEAPSDLVSVRVKLPDGTIEVCCFNTAVPTSTGICWQSRRLATVPLVSMKQCMATIFNGACCGCTPATMHARSVCAALSMYHACVVHMTCNCGADDVQNLGKHQPHITIAHKDMRPSLASISSLGKSDDGGSQAPCSSSAAMHQSEGPLSHAHTSAATAACCGGSSSSKSPDSQPAEVHRPLGGLLHLDKDSFEHVVHDLQDKVTEVSTLLKGTTASGVLHKLRSSEKTLKETRGKVQDAQKKVKDGRWQKALRGGPSKWLARRSVPWLWNVSPGASASVQLGAAGRLPVDSQEVVRLLLGRGEGPRPGVSSQNGSLWGSLFAPLAHRLCMQPLLRARLEGTVGKFRSITGDHTSAVLELETCSRAVGAARAGPELLQSQQPPGLRHVVSLSAKQQIVGPVRACVDLRWEVGSSAQSAGDDVARGGPSLGRIQRYCQGLTARHTGLNVGVDASFGVVRAAAWYSMHHRQGMVELRV